MGYPYYAVTSDHAGAHSMTYWPDVLAGKGETSRYDIPRGQPGWIRLERCQLIPGARKVPDSAQCPVEMLISKCKQAGHNEAERLAGMGPLTWQQQVQAAITGAKQSLTLERIQKAWEHGMQACRIFCGKWGTVVEAQARGKTWEAFCTDGNYVPRPFNG